MRSSLSLRLLIAAALTTALALVATAFVLNLLFRHYFEDRSRAELETFLVLLSGQVGVNAAGEIDVAPLADPRFDQPLSGFYWQIRIDQQEPRLSPSMWAAPLVLQRPPNPGIITFEDALMGTGDAVAVASWVITIGDGEGLSEVFLAVAIDRSDLDISVAGFFSNSVIWLASLGVFLMVASWFQVRHGLRPLEKVRSEVNLVANSATAHLSEDYPSEVLPLVQEVNQLLDTNTATLERIRSGAGNLAHGLKTPLTIMRGVERKMRKTGQSALADEIATEITNMEHIVERELARSRDSHQMTRKCAVAPIAARLRRALSRRPGAEEVSWEIAVPETLTAPFDAFDMTELMGNLVDNGLKWTESRLRISAKIIGMQTVLEIEDDGPGVPGGEIEAVLERGRRLDANQPGSGLGLSIVKDMAVAHGCDLTLDRSPMGGLRVRISWPTTPNA